MALNQAFIQKRDTALQIATEKGITAAYCKPLLFRLLWKAGIAIRPPHYLSFHSAALLMGIYFALAWEVLMTLFSRFGSRTGQAPSPGMALIAGALYGAAMGMYFSHARWTGRLPDWSEIR